MTCGCSTGRDDGRIVVLGEIVVKHADYGRTEWGKAAMVVFLLMPLNETLGLGVSPGLDAL
jgi:hypothetical protein